MTPNETRRVAARVLDALARIAAQNEKDIDPDIRDVNADAELCLALRLAAAGHINESEAAAIIAAFDNAKGYA